jgi:O-glycosyl hydrolase
MKPWHTLNESYLDQFINEAYEAGINASCLYIQNELKINSGDIAGICFSKEVETFKDRLRDYIKTEFIMNEKQ